MPLYDTGAIAVLCFGDKDLLVVAIANGGDDEWNNRQLYLTVSGTSTARFPSAGWHVFPKLEVNRQN